MCQHHGTSLSLGIRRGSSHELRSTLPRRRPTSCSRGFFVPNNDNSPLPEDDCAEDELCILLRAVSATRKRMASSTKRLVFALAAPARLRRWSRESSLPPRDCARNLLRSLRRANAGRCAGRGQSRIRKRIPRRAGALPGMPAGTGGAPRRLRFKNRTGYDHWADIEEVIMRVGLDGTVVTSLPD